MILLVNEQINFTKRFVQGISYDEDSFAIDLIDTVSHGGAYVSQKHTAKHFRREIYYPEYFNRKQYHAWKVEGSLTLNDKLDKKVKSIIEADAPTFIDERTEKVFNEIISDRAKELGIEYQ